jgi:pseudaminic acid cytidylyltransferase
MKIAIIPARGGSKRIPKKNIIDFHGKPMIYYSLMAAKKSNLFDEIHVSTDNQEIAETVKSLGFQIQFLRDQKLADDYTPVMEVAKFVISKFKELGKNFDSFTMIMPCSPLLLASDLISANNIFEKNGSQTPVLSVAKFPSPIEWSLVEKDGILQPSHEHFLTTRSQDLPEQYFDTGTFSVQSAKNLLVPTSVVKMSFLKYELPLWRAIDIDEQDQLDLAKKMFSLL